MPEEFQLGKYVISTDPARLNLDTIEAFLRQSYWAADRPREVIERSIRHTLCFGMYDGSRQIGFARVTTDHATFAYLGDVFVDQAYRGEGLGKWLIATILGHPALQGLRRWMLATRDAQGLYRQFGFETMQEPQRWMELYRPDP